MPVTLSSRHTFPTRIVFLTKENARNVRDFAGEPNEIALDYKGDSVVISVGLGDARECSADTLRVAAGNGIRRVHDLKRTGVSVILPEGRPGGEGSFAAVIEGTLLGNYRFVKYKSEPPVALDAIEFVGNAIAPEELRRLDAVCAATAYARDLVNENASVMTPERLAAEARALGRGGKLRVTILDEKEIAAQGLHLLRAVGQGSTTPPRLIVVEYAGNRSSKEKTGIIGKGITFDSGGQNLKPTGHIETMRCDMAGAAAVLGVMRSLVAIRAKVNVVGCIAAAHNAIGERAYFPGDIHQSFEGKTVEILSTDAEGRLVLADAVSYCRKRYRPGRMIDLATLTGGILSALGDTVAGLFSNDDALAGALFAAGERTGERLWRFPLYREYRESLKSDIADLRNLSKLKRGYAGSITGAAFIQEFTGDLPWAHLDIAGTAWNDGPARGEVPAFGTGFGVRLLVDFLTRE
ncbi:MAG: leucyl aminopeptidase [Chitinispirillaceae bacterium]|jgi:leucyl aminopeptidase